MSGFKGLAKGGWHPKGKGEGGRESWRGDFKGINTVAGWKDKAMGKSKEAGEDAHEHVSAPLSTLKDPSSFGPPPKHRAYYGDAAGPPRSRPTREQEQARQREEEEANEQPPPGTYAADTTGLSTAHLPKPPASRPGQTLPPAMEQSTKPKTKPSLPPRLPPRQNSHPDAHAPAPPPPYTESAQDDSASGGYLNQGALNRLGQAGVSVPGLDISRNASPPVPRRTTASPALASPPPVAARSPQVTELQSRFAQMPTRSSSSTAPPVPPSTGTTWAEKQAALKTANNLHKDASKVTLGEVRSAASTANNFRERHGAQAAAGWKAASNLNQKYGISARLNNVASGSTASPRQSPTKGLGKKAAPPPPPKKKELGGSEPPLIPLSSKPKF